MIKKEKYTMSTYSNKNFKHVEIRLATFMNSKRKKKQESAHSNENA